MDVYYDEDYLEKDQGKTRKRRKYIKSAISKIIPKSAKRVENSTDSEINKKIYKETLLNIGRYLDKNNEEISARIEKLEGEWDVERILEANASSLILTGLVLGCTVDKKWYMLSGTVGGFLLQHALQGWCPPLPIIRRMGYRTPTEIHEEISALKFIRGDFEHLRRD